MFAKGLVIAASMLSVAQIGYSRDLPDTGVAKKKASFVEIYEIKSAQISDFSYTPGSPTTGSEKMAGLVQLELSVQGNICGNNPSSLAVAMKYNKDGSGTELSLVTSGPYAPKPGVMYACLAYFKGSTITVPVAIDDYIYSGRVNEPHKFIIELDDSVKKLVTATINTTTKTYDVVVEDLR